MTESGSSTAMPIAPRKNEGPPKLRFERLLELLGQFPALLGRGLDRLERVPVLGWVVSFFSSVWLGLLWLLLIGLYIAVGSGMASVRAYFELTDLEFFDAWPMQVLLVLMSVTLMVVTLRRIPLTLYKLGVWLVHTGIITLIIGCVLYFSQKVEGLTRIYLGKTADAFYDATERALYVYRVQDNGDLANEAMIPLPRLPIYYEHLAERGNALQRQIDPAALSRVTPPLGDVPMHITGYYPDAQLRQDAWGPGPAGATPSANPAIAVSIGTDTVRDEQLQWLVGKKPAGRVWESATAGLGMEYLFAPDAQRIRDVSTSFKGEMALTVRVPKAKVEQLIVLEGDKPAAIAGTPYTLKVLGPAPRMSIASKGYEGASSGGMLIEVRRKDDQKELVFTRDVLFRYPELSPDFIIRDGQQKRIQERVDNDIQLVLHDATMDQLWIVQPSEDPAWQLIHRARGGTVQVRPLTSGQVVPVNIARMGLKFSVQQYTPNAVPRMRPLITPVQQRQRATSAQELIQRGLIELRIASVAEPVYVPSVQFADTSGLRGPPPTVVDVPEVGKIALLLSTRRWPLPAPLLLAKFDLVLLPGSQDVAIDYISTLRAIEQRRTAGTVQRTYRTLTARLNEPAEYRDLYFFQAQWDGDPRAKPAARFTVLGVANRPGVNVMLAGCILMLCGVVHAFYIKPILLALRKRTLAAGSSTP